MSILYFFDCKQLFAGKGQAFRLVVACGRPRRLAGTRNNSHH